MFKTIFVSIVLAASLSACSNIYQGSAPASDGGQFVAGQFARGFITPPTGALYHCPSSPNGEDCERVDVEFK